MSLTQDSFLCSLHRCGLQRCHRVKKFTDKSLGKIFARRFCTASCRSFVGVYPILGISMCNHEMIIRDLDFGEGRGGRRVIPRRVLSHGYETRWVGCLISTAVGFR